MAAFTFRMGAGFPGDVNRAHPVTIEPCLIDANSPPLLYGSAVVVDATTQGVRQMATGDTSLTAVYGFGVRPYPVQQSAATNFGATSFGTAAPPASGVIDVMRAGYMMVQLGGTASAVKGNPVEVWVAATTTGHVQGQVEAAHTGGSSIPLTSAGSVATFNGNADAGGVVEIAFNI